MFLISNIMESPSLPAAFIDSAPRPSLSQRAKEISRNSFIDENIVYLLKIFGYGRKMRTSAKVQFLGYKPL